MTPIKIPTHVDDPMQYLLWSTDEAVPIGVLIAIGVMTEELTLMLILSYFALKWYRRIRDGQPAGFVKHWLWQLGVSPFESASVHSPFITRWY